nr:hypothetical protein [Tanacetum cinerariifolium]
MAGRRGVARQTGAELAWQRDGAPGACAATPAGAPPARTPVGETSSLGQPASLNLDSSRGLPTERARGKARAGADTTERAAHRSNPLAAVSRRSPEYLARGGSYNCRRRTDSGRNGPNYAAWFLSSYTSVGSPAVARLILARRRRGFPADRPLRTPQTSSVQ